MEQDLSVPTITIDGGAGTGKGTARRNVALALGFNELDSGVMYRALGVQAYKLSVSFEDILSLVTMAQKLNIRTEGEQVFIDNIDCTSVIRCEEAGKLASSVARIQAVRSAFRCWQFKQRKLPGLVADGRDMGFIFDTPHRFYLVTSAEERARRRVVQLQRLGRPASYEDILAGIILRDEADKNNPANRLCAHPNAIVIDNSNLRSEDTKELILEWYKKRI